MVAQDNLDLWKRNVLYLIPLINKINHEQDPTKKSQLQQKLNTIIQDLDRIVKRDNAWISQICLNYEKNIKPNTQYEKEKFSLNFEVQTPKIDFFRQSSTYKMKILQEMYEKNGMRAAESYREDSELLKENFGRFNSKPNFIREKVFERCIQELIR